jgi:hypothetical protein
MGAQVGRNAHVDYHVEYEGRLYSVRRLRVPKGVLVHYADVPASERIQIGAVPVTSPFQTLCDCVAAHVSPELVDAAVKQARARGLIDKEDVKAIRARSRAA